MKKSFYSFFLIIGAQGALAQTAEEYYAKYEALYATKKHEKSITPLQKSANMGYAKAEYDLGVAYANGQGVEKDKKKAAYWIDQAYKNGDVDAKKTWNENELWKYK